MQTLLQVALSKHSAQQRANAIRASRRASSLVARSRSRPRRLRKRLPGTWRNCTRISARRLASALPALSRNGTPSQRALLMNSATAANVGHRLRGAHRCRLSPPRRFWRPSVGPSAPCTAAGAQSSGGCVHAGGDVSAQAAVGIPAGLHVESAQCSRNAPLSADTMRPTSEHAALSSIK